MDSSIIRVQVKRIARKGSSQPGKFGVQFPQRDLQHFTMTRTLGGFELLDYPPPRAHDPFSLSL
jgi:hypothetical protein